MEEYFEMRQGGDFCNAAAHCPGANDTEGLDAQEWPMAENGLRTLLRRRI